MALSKKLLSQDEVVVRHMHTHIKVILPQIIGEILLVLAAAIGFVLRPGRLALLGAADHLDRGSGSDGAPPVDPVGQVDQFHLHGDHQAHYHPQGVFTRTGHDLPLTRISDVQLEKNVDDRLFGCGTLALQTSADDPLLLRDVPQVETVQVEISNLIFNDIQGAIDADPTN